MSLHLKAKTIWEISEHARVTYPEECCGIILGDTPNTKNEDEYVRSCKNIQNQRHAEDPKAYPRDARTAYLMAPDDLLKINLESEQKNRPIKAFYHSHPDHPSYFSEKDKADAMLWGEPAYPNSAYIVLSVYDGEVRDLKAFAWNHQKSDFTSVAVMNVGNTV